MKTKYFNKGERKIIRFMHSVEEPMSMFAISNKSKIPYPTVHEAMPRLVKLQIVLEKKALPDSKSKRMKYVFNKKLVEDYLKN